MAVMKNVVLVLVVDEVVEVVMVLMAMAKA